MLFHLSVAFTLFMLTLQGPENWMVYRAWWGNQPVMAKGDLSDVAGVNSFNAVHPVRSFYSDVCIVHKPYAANTVHSFFFFSENYSSVDFRRSRLKQKWIFVEQNWSEHSGSMVVHAESLVSFQPTQHLLSLRWNPIEWQIWH